MKSSISYFLLFVGTIFVSIGLYQSFEQKNLLRELEWQNQKSALKLGINVEWQDFYLDYYKKHPTNLAYTLTQEEKENFFPPDNFPKIQWTDYNSVLDKKEYLLNKLNNSYSPWERAVIIYLLNDLKVKLNKSFLSPFEKTIINYDDYQAYNKILMNPHLTELPSIAQLEKPKLAFEKIKHLNLDLNSDYTVKIRHQIMSPTVILDLWAYIIGLISIFFSLIIFLVNTKNKYESETKQAFFFQTILHEIYTPFTALKLNLELPLEHQNIRDIQLNMHEMEDTIDQFTFLGKNQVMLNLIHTYEEIDQLFSEINEKFSSVDFTLENLKSNVWGNLLSIKVIIVNLLRNALKYGKDVSFFAYHSKEYYIIEVENKGDAISRIESWIIFQQFGRIISKSNKRRPGLGLGLYVSKKLANDMQGKLFLKNPGKINPKFVLQLRVKNAPT